MTKVAVLGAASASLILSGATGAAAAPAADDPIHGTSVLSDNLLQLPVNIPTTVCGNAINILSLAPAIGDGCAAPEAAPEVDDEVVDDEIVRTLAFLRG